MHPPITPSGRLPWVISNTTYAWMDKLVQSEPNFVREPGVADNHGRKRARATSRSGPSILQLARASGTTADKGYCNSTLLRDDQPVLRSDNQLLRRSDSQSLRCRAMVNRDSGAAPSVLKHRLNQAEPRRSVGRQDVRPPDRTTLARYAFLREYRRHLGLRPVCQG